MLLQSTASGQIDQRKLDSLARSIDSSAGAQKKWQDSFIRRQDSNYRSDVSSAFNRRPGSANGKEMQGRGAGNEKRFIPGVLAGLLFILLIVFGWTRIKKRKG